jgi:hypothetical protein
VRRFEANAAHQQIDPVVGIKLPARTVGIEIERANLNGLDIVDPERAAFAAGLVVIVMPEVDLGLDTAHQQ